MIVTQAPPDPAGIVLVLHGGQETSRRPARRHQLAVLRMIPIARAAAAASDQLVVLRVLHAVRGWNGADASPVADAQWAIAEAHRRYGADLPTCLIGHSMGGRTAFRAAGDPSVRSVIGLAPWLPPGEPVAQVTGRKVLIVHGSADRTTAPGESAAFARALAGRAAQVSYVEVPGEKHGMLRRRDAFDGLAAGFAAGTLAGVPPDRTDLSGHPNILGRALAGEARLIA